jgi:hypothetical protein
MHRRGTNYPAWGVTSPQDSVWWIVRIVLVATAVGGISGSAAVLSLVGDQLARPAAALSGMPSSAEFRDRPGGEIAGAPLKVPPPQPSLAVQPNSAMPKPESASVEPASTEGVAENPVDALFDPRTYQPKSTERQDSIVQEQKALPPERVGDPNSEHLGEIKPPHHQPATPIRKLAVGRLRHAGPRIAHSSPYFQTW